MTKKILVYLFFQVLHGLAIWYTLNPLLSTTALFVTGFIYAFLTISPINWTLSQVKPSNASMAVWAIVNFLIILYGGLVLTASTFTGLALVFALYSLILYYVRIYFLAAMVS